MTMLGEAKRRKKEEEEEEGEEGRRRELEEEKKREGKETVYLSMQDPNIRERGRMTY